MREQIEYTLRNLKTALASQGADFSHVAKTTVVVMPKPASTLLQVVRLADPGLKIEIEAVAVLP